MHKPSKIEKIRFLDLTYIVAMWLFTIGLMFFPDGLAYFTGQFAEDNKKYAEISLVTGAFCLILASYLSYRIYRHHQSAKEWGGAFYEFNDIQIRVLTTMRGEPVFNFTDVLDALEINIPADRSRLLAACRLRQQIYGDETEVYIIKQAVWDMLAHKSGRLAIRFRAYLQEIPEFRQDVAENSVDSNNNA